MRLLVLIVAVLAVLIGVNIGPNLTYAGSLATLDVLEKSGWSADDHVIEPPNLWTDRVPARHKADCPRVEVFDGHAITLGPVLITLKSRGRLWLRVWPRRSRGLSR